MNSIKNIALSMLDLLPKKVQLFIKKAHYEGIVRTVSEADEPSFKIIKYLVGAGDDVIDAGSNIGTYTRFLSELVGENGRVYSIEPVPMTYEILCSNIKRMSLINVGLMNYALSDAAGYVNMAVPLYDKGGKNYYRARVMEEASDKKNGFAVKSTTLDLLFSEVDRRIAFIKIDVEGAEYKCIKGALGIIEKSTPSCLVEISGNPDDPDSSAHKTLQIFTEKGYGVYWLDKTILKKRRPGESSVDYFFLAEKHLSKLQNMGVAT